MQEKIYQCICGQEFTKPNSFNGHKSNCVVHKKAKGTYEARMEQRMELGKQASEKNMVRREIRKSELLTQWISEQHTCEKCGVIMTEKFGPGRFCSRKCSNSRRFTEEAIIKKSRKAKITSKRIGELKHQITLETYALNPSICQICGQPLSWEKRDKKTCGKTCYGKLRSLIRIKTMEEVGLQHNTLFNYKYGFYKGVECDSSWELAFLIYHLDHDSGIYRNKQSFSYIDNEGRYRNYYPDFIIGDTYYEIKGYKNDTFESKCTQFPEKLIVIDLPKIKKIYKILYRKLRRKFCRTL